MYERHILGKKGEDVAVEYLKSKGYNILDRNFLCRQGEIDVIALDKNYAIERVVASDITTEFDKLIDRQLERASISTIVGFNCIFPNAIRVFCKQV